MVVCWLLSRRVGISAKHKSMTLISSSVTLTLILFCSPKDLKIKTWQTSLKQIQYLYDRIDSGCKQDSKPNQYSQQHSRVGGLSLSQSRLSYTVSRILLCSHLCFLWIAMMCCKVLYIHNFDFNFYFPYHFHLTLYYFFFSRPPSPILIVRGLKSGWARRLRCA